MIAKLKRALWKAADPEFQLSETEKQNLAFLRTLSKPLAFVCSYPRSGNTWLRYLMADCLLQTAGYECSTELPVHPNVLIPDFHCHNAVDIKPMTGISEHFYYKTHFAPLQMGHLIGITQTHNLSYIYLYRDPADALISYYYYKLRYPQYYNVAEKGPNLFCSQEIGNWVDHVEQAIRFQAKGNKICFIKYEDLHAATSDALQAIWTWLNIVISPSVCGLAATHMEFSSLQDLERRTTTNTSPHSFFRSGVVGAAQNELNNCTTDIIRARSKDVLSRADAAKLKI